MASAEVSETNSLREQLLTNAQYDLRLLAKRGRRLIKGLAAATDGAQHEQILLSTTRFEK